MRKSKLTVPELSRRSGLSQSWIKAAKTGRIDRPDPAKLQAVAAETGGNAETLFALSNQLGAASSTAGPKPSGDVAGPAALYKALERQATLISNLTIAVAALAAKGGPADDPVKRWLEELMSQGPLGFAPDEEEEDDPPNEDGRSGRLA